MSTKGENTKQFICSKACELFAEKGFKDVTMQDICERTGLSRGGLYRHYESTAQIFTEIMQVLLDHQENEFAGKIKDHIPASQILCEVLTRYEKEMIDSQNSLSIAIYEFFSKPQAKDNHSISRQYLVSQKMWLELIEYGMRTGEFRKVEPEAVFDLIVFSYQGVRMYSRLMPIDISIPQGITRQIKYLLLAEESAGAR